MDMQKLVSRINELAQKKRSVGLNAAELTEQQQLYREYLAVIRCQLKSHLDNIEFTDKNDPRLH